MNEEDDIYQLFLELMKQLQEEAPVGRLRVLSKNPRYAADDPAAQQIIIKHTER